MMFSPIYFRCEGGGNNIFMMFSPIYFKFVYMLLILMRGFDFDFHGFHVLFVG